MQQSTLPLLPVLDETKDQNNDTPQVATNNHDHDDDDEDSSSSSSSSLVGQQLDQGQALLKAEMYDQAWEHFSSMMMAHAALSSLSRCRRAVSLLSKRAQDWLHQGQYALALADAAAGLTLVSLTTTKESLLSSSESTGTTACCCCCSSSSCCWETYHIALSHLQDDKDGVTTTTTTTKAQVLERILPAFFQAIPQLAKVQKEQEEESCSAWQACRLELVPILQAWAQCALGLNMPHDALAISWASLCIAGGYVWNHVPSTDAVCTFTQCLVRLHGPYLAVQAIECMQQSSMWNTMGDDKNRPLRQVHLFASYLDKLLRASHNNNNHQNNTSHQLWVNKVPLVKVPAAFWPNWYAKNAMEIYHTGSSKGRGVRALQPLPAGQVILVERALIRCEAKSATIQEANAMLRVKMEQRSQRDAIFTSICNQLYDGGISSCPPPMTKFDKLLLHLEQGDLVLLPSKKRCNVSSSSSSSDVENEPPALNARRAAGIIKNNAHGLNYYGTDDNDQLRATELFPALDMFNHDVNPNCKYCKLSKAGAQDLAVCMTNRPVAAGEELTISYGSNQELIRQNFGF